MTERREIAERIVGSQCICSPAFKIANSCDPACAYCNYADEITAALDAAFADGLEAAAKIANRYGMNGTLAARAIRAQAKAPKDDERREK